MSAGEQDGLQLIVEDADGELREQACERLAIRWQGRELWIQPGPNGQLMLGVEDEEGASEYANLLLRPQAANLVSLALEMEPVEAVDDHEHDHQSGCCGHCH